MKKKGIIVPSFMHLQFPTKLQSAKTIYQKMCQELILILLYLFTMIQGFRTFSFFKSAVFALSTHHPSSTGEAKKLVPLFSRLVFLFKLITALMIRTGETSNNVLPSSILVVSQLHSTNILELKRKLCFIDRCRYRKVDYHSYQIFRGTFHRLIIIISNVS